MKMMPTMTGLLMGESCRALLGPGRQECLPHTDVIEDHVAASEKKLPIWRNFW